MNRIERKRLAFGNAQCILRGLPVDTEGIRLLAEEAMLAFGQVAAAKHHLWAIVFDEPSKSEALAELRNALRVVELPPEVSRQLDAMNLDEQIASGTLLLLKLLEAEADTRSASRRSRESTRPC